MKPQIRSSLAPLAVLSCLFLAGIPGAAQRPPGVAGKPSSGPETVVVPPKSVTVPIEAPMKLSDPDGQDLVLEELSVKAAIHGMLSLTELEMRFRNPHSRRMEGRFTSVLPAGAAISRFAKEVNGQLMEGEVVERLRANRIYDEILHQMRDPALLEQDQGNRFSARIFPIEARSSVRLVLSYSQLLPLTGGVRTYSLPLRGLPTIGRFSFHGVLAPLPGEAAARSGHSELKISKSAKTSSVETVELEEERFTPEEDLELTWRRGEGSPRVQVLTAGEFVLTAFRPDVPAPAARPGPKSWVFFVDTSASAAEGMRHHPAALSALFGSLPPGDDVDVSFFDQDVFAAGRLKAQEWAKRIGPALSERHFLGGTNLGLALSRMTSAAGKAGASHVVLVSDGVATLGKTGRGELSAMASLPPGVALHALVLGSRQDLSVLEALTRGRGRVVGIPYSDQIREKSKEAARLLSRPLGAEFEIFDKTSEWVFPAKARDVQPGSEIIVLGKTRPGQQPSARLSLGNRVTLSGEDRAQALPGRSFGPLLEREAYRAYLSSLSERQASEPDAAMRKAIATERVRISVEQRILIPETTLLVLETEQDYQRFGLDRRALAAILTVGLSGIERLDRRNQGFITSGPAQAGEPPVKTAQVRKDAPKKAKIEESADKPGEQVFSEAASTQRSREKDEGSVRAGEKGSVGAVEDRMAAGAGSPAAVTNAPRPPAPQARPANETSRQEQAAAPAVTQDLSVVAEPAPAPPPPPQGTRASSADARSPRPSRGTTRVTGGGAAAPAWTVPEVPSEEMVKALENQIAANPLAREPYAQLAEALFARADWKRLRRLAYKWQEFDPENPHVYEALGEALMNLGLKGESLRAFGSLTEVAVSKPELLQRAGLLLFRAGDTEAALVPLRRALELRPDRMNAYRHLALVLFRANREAEAARVLEAGLSREFPGWSASSGRRVLSEELGYVLRSWIQKDPRRKPELLQKARELGVDLGRKDAMRITLAWETDANDVDLHVADPNGEDCFYGRRSVASGLELYEDVTRGFGPEVIRASRVMPGVYAAGVNYFSAGPMGVSRGVVVVMRPGKGETPDVHIVPFRLVPGSREMRLLARMEILGGNPAVITD